MSRHNERPRVEVLLRYSNALSQHNMRRAYKEIVELGHDIEIIVATKPKTKQKDCRDI